MSEKAGVRKFLLSSKLFIFVFATSRKLSSKEIGLCWSRFWYIILQLSVKLRKDSVTFSPHMLAASLAVMLFVLVTNIDNTTEELQNNKIFETFDGEKNKTMLICQIS